MQRNDLKWRNVKLIFFREIRDQMRDRRTMFMIFVLPLLLYPLLGMSMFQVAQFVSEKPSTVAVFISRANLERLRPAIADPDTDPNDSDAAKPEHSSDDTAAPEIASSTDSNHFSSALWLFGTEDRFQSSLFDKPEDAELLDIRFITIDGRDAETIRQQASALIDNDLVDTAVIIPNDLSDRIAAIRDRIRQGESNETNSAEKPRQEITGPSVIFSSANEKSQIGSVRVQKTLNSWRNRIGANLVEQGGVPGWTIRPFDTLAEDTTVDTEFQGAAMWSKMLPVLLIIWALTGAFYPAIDLCAGEKERGTLETLLCSPAERSEIVTGKLLTIMVFSMVTSTLNVASIGVTGTLVVSQMQRFGSPAPISFVWLMIALVPVAALFSALCLTLASFARSTKEGQYYLMPLLLVTMMLVVLPMAPSVELNFGNSLIPITGLVLLLRGLLEGDYLMALRFTPIVALVTAGCCYLAIRAAIDQFNSEKVLFSGGDRFDLRLWLRHLIRDRQPTPTFAQAISCGILILIVRFFASLAMPADTSGMNIVELVVLPLVVTVLLPVLVLTFLLTRDPVKTLQLKCRRWATIPLAMLAALFMHPAIHSFGELIQWLYPISSAVEKQVDGSIGTMMTTTPLWLILVCMAITPAIVEELAFRGFMLSGFRHLGNKNRAVLLSALFFGATHGIIQQSMVTTVVGFLIGYVVVQSGTIWAGVAFHAVNNSMALIVGQLKEWAAVHLDTSAGAWTAWLMGNPGNETSGMLYDWSGVAIASIIALALFAWFYNLSYEKTAEEQQRDELAQA